MNAKHSLESFISDIDKILSGESIIPCECDDLDEEYRELLLLAQLLVKADYTITNKDRVEKVVKRIISNASKDGELLDDELDLVAGGVNLSEMLDEKNKN